MPQQVGDLFYGQGMKNAVLIFYAVDQSGGEGVSEWVEPFTWNIGVVEQGVPSCSESWGTKKSAVFAGNQWTVISEIIIFSCNYSAPYPKNLIDLTW